MDAAIGLKRSFLLTAVFVTLAVTLGFGYYAAVEVRRDLIQRSRQEATRTSRNIYSQLRVEHQLAEAGDLARLLRDTARRAGVRRSLQRIVSELEIPELRIFDAAGTLLFSLSEETPPGENEAGSEGLASALAGHTQVELLDPHEESHLAGYRPRQAVMESYAPVYHQATDTEPAYVIELYQDASALNAQFRLAYYQVGRGLALAMALLTAALYLIVRRANRTIRNQTRALSDANASLAALKEGLEGEAEMRSRQLIQAEKLASLGRLAAGVAHEINTPLGSISACSEGLLRDLGDARNGHAAGSEDLQEYLGVIRDEAFRCKQITRGLLDLAQPAPSEPQATCPEALIERTLSLVKYQADERGATLAFEPAGRGGEIMGDPAQLQQVLLNVTTNAIQASSQGGAVTWSLSWSAERLILACRDDGAGIASDELSAVFDPFFSTKDPGQGTGLGLSLCHQIVAAHGGEIGIESPGPGLGTTVTITLPASRS